MKISSPPWAELNDLKELLHVLSPAKIVGGAVRNAILGIPLSDLDVATELLPEVAWKLAKKAGFQVIPTGLAHGTITCVKDGAYEVTTLRVDKITDGRHATVEFSRSWEGDAERRDFTINGLYSDFEGEVVDFVGGLEDLKEKYLRFIGDPKERIKEDYLRILRFFRFYAHYCEKYDQASLQACLDLADNLKIISRERCTYEFVKTLSAERCVEALKLMSEQIFASAGLPRLLDTTLNTLQKISLTTIGKLSLFGEGSELVLSRRNNMLVKELKSLEDMCELKDYVRWINTCSEEVLWDGIRLKGKNPEIGPEELEIWIKNPFPLQGRDIMALGYAQGPEISEILNSAREIFYSQPQPLSKKELLKVAKINFNQYNGV